MPELVTGGALGAVAVAELAAIVQARARMEEQARVLARTEAMIAMLVAEAAGAAVDATTRVGYDLSTDPPRWWLVAVAAAPPAVDPAGG
jgi:hypothetical protein